MRVVVVSAATGVVTAWMSLLALLAVVEVGEKRKRRRAAKAVHPATVTRFEVIQGDAS